jgi:hypothetical protein
MIDTYNDPYYNRNSPYFDRNENDDDLSTFIEIIEYDQFLMESKDEFSFDDLQDNDLGYDANIMKYNQSLIDYLGANNIEFKIIKL